MPIQINIENTLIVVPEASDPCELWVNYFNTLKAKVGTQHAKTIFLVTWQKNGSAICTTNASFNTWLKKNDIDVSNAATRAIADVMEIRSNFIGLGKNLTKVASFAVPTVLAFSLVIIGMILWNTAKKADVTDLAMLTPTGRTAGTALKLLGK